MLDTQKCYICGAYFEDKVKLGIHLTPCYNEAVNIRKEMWHPHPLDLVDEQRYTEYMRGRFQQREKQFEHAAKEKVSFVTADSFSAMRGNLAQAPANLSRDAGKVPSRTGGSQAPPPIPTAPTRVAPQTTGTGVTKLRHELSDELARIKELRQSEEYKMEERQRMFDQLCNQMDGGPRSLPRRDTQHVPLPSVQVGHRAPVAEHSPPRQREAPLERLSPGAVQSPPSREQPPSGPQTMPDGRVQCEWCGKLFGRKGYDVHVKRCSRPQNDFTWSRDAEFVRHKPESHTKADHDAVSYGRQHGENAPVEDDQWTQFMVTYPRPVLEERPRLPHERAASAARQQQQRQLGQQPPRIEKAEPTVPCGRCGRYFYVSRVAAHEATCVARPKK